MKQLLATACLAAPLLTLVACVADDEAAAPDAPDGAAPHLIVAVDRPSGNRVEFHATADGELLLSESGPNDNLPTLPPAVAMTVDPLVYYRALTDGAEPPAELRALVEQTADDRAAARVPAAPLVLTDGPRPAGGNRSARWFEDAACHQYSDPEIEWCLLNRTADSTKSHSDVKDVYSVVSVDEGEVDFDRRIRPWWEWSTSTWTVTAGHWKSWWRDAGVDFDFQARIRHASGDLYHHAGMACTGRCALIAPL